MKSICVHLKIFGVRFTTSPRSLVIPVTNVPTIVLNLIIIRIFINSNTAQLNHPSVYSLLYSDHNPHETLLPFSLPFVPILPFTALNNNDKLLHIHTMSLTTSLSVTDILAAANSNENGSSSSDMWNCLNCLLDTSCEVLECKYCEAPKAFSDKKRQEIEEEKRKKVEALFVEEEKRDGLVGTGDSDDPIVLDEDPVIVLPSNTNEDVVDLISDDDDNYVVEVSNTGSKRSSPNRVDGQGKKKIKLEFEPKKFGEANDPDGEVIEVLPPLEEEDMVELQEIFGEKMSENVTDQGPMTCINADKDEDVVFISSNATMSRDMPHARHCCPIHIFQQGQIDSDPYDYFNYRVKRKFSIEDTTNNSKYCSNCYCYVCDVPAKSCSRWNTKISSSQNNYKNNHCNASDKENHWQKARKIVTNKFGQILIGLTETINKENHQVSSNCADDDDIVPHQIQSLIDQAKISVDAIESSYQRYVLATSNH